MGFLDTDRSQSYQLTIPGHINLKELCDEIELFSPCLQGRNERAIGENMEGLTVDQISS